MEYNLVDIAQEGDIEALKDYILNNPEEINGQDVYGWTALHYSALEGHIDCVKFLVKKGADITLKNMNGNTPLHECVGQPKCLKFLIECGADVNAQNNEGISPLYYSIEGEDIKSAKILIKNGASCYIKNNNGDTPLSIIEDKNLKAEIEKLSEKYFSFEIKEP